MQIWITFTSLKCRCFTKCKCFIKCIWIILAASRFCLWYLCMFIFLCLFICGFGIFPSKQTLLRHLIFNWTISGSVLNWKTLSGSVFQTRIGFCVGWPAGPPARRCREVSSWTEKSKSRSDRYLSGPCIWKAPVRFRLVTWRRSPKQGSDEFAQRYFVDGKSNCSSGSMKTMLTFLSLTGLCSIMDLYSVPRIETFFWYDFDTSFLSKLYAINHYPRG